jgi:hypothetical protein
VGPEGLGKKKLQNLDPVITFNKAFNLQLAHICQITGIYLLIILINNQDKNLSAFLILFHLSFHLFQANVQLGSRADSSSFSFLQALPASYSEGCRLVTSYLFDYAYHFITFLGILDSQNYHCSREQERLLGDL